jgi:hypothetical protein
MRIHAGRGNDLVVVLIDIAVCVIVADLLLFFSAADLISKSKQSTPQEMNDGPDEPDSYVDPQPWIDFLDLDGDKVVYPWQFEFRNIDRFLNRSEIEQVVVYLVIDGEIHGSGLIIASWQKRIVQDAIVNLPPGEYVASLKVADYATDDLLGLGHLTKHGT